MGSPPGKWKLVMSTKLRYKKLTVIVFPPKKKTRLLFWDRKISLKKGCLNCPKNGLKIQYMCGYSPSKLSKRLRIKELEIFVENPNLRLVKFIPIQQVGLLWRLVIVLLVDIPIKATTKASINRMCQALWTGHFQTWCKCPCRSAQSRSREVHSTFHPELNQKFTWATKNTLITGCLIGIPIMGYDKPYNTG